MPELTQKILREVLDSIKPRPEEKRRLLAVAKNALRIAGKEAKKVKGKAMLAGSITRDTWLPGKMEFDVFIMLPSSMSEKELEDLGLKFGKKVITDLKGKYRVEYAQHPYVSGDASGVNIDVVPCFDVKDPLKMKSAVDRTPFHVKYIERHLRPAMADQVRLLKQLCKANMMYGADAKTEGFSGYVCELLTIKYGDFLGVLKGTAEWAPGHIIDIEGHFPAKDFHKIKKTFKEQTLILIDPTDSRRNTAAAVSSENFFRLKKIARNFLKAPSKDFFFERAIKPVDEKELIQLQMKRRTELLMIKFSPPDVVPDILWPQLRRFSERLQDILEEVKYEFKVLRRDSYTNEKDLAVVLLEMEVSKLPAVQKRVGPKVSDHDDSMRFVEKYKTQSMTGPFIEENYWVVEVNRKFLSARDKLNDSLSRDAEILKAKGIPNFIADQIPKGFEIVSENEKMMEIISKDPNFGIFLRRYFEKDNLA
jgi:tRNA nucleotidyltransferase (CCA-adding enzyme)